MAPLHYLVAGGCGSVGFYLSRRLLAHGHRVTILDDLSGVESAANMQEVVDYALCRIVVADATKPETYRLPGMPKPWEVDRAFFVAETDGEWKRIDLQLRGINEWEVDRAFFVAETDGEWKRIDLQLRGINELARWATRKDRRPAKSKLPRLLVVTSPDMHQAADAALELHAEAGLEMRSVRLYDVYGPRLPWRSAIRGIVQNLVEGRDVRLMDGGQQRRTYMHLEDVSVALFKAMDRAKMDPIIEVGGLIEWRMGDLAELLRGRMSSRARVVSLEGSSGKPLRYCQGDNGAFDLLGWRPQRTIPATMAELIAWERDREDMTSAPYDEDAATD